MSTTTHLPPTMEAVGISKFGDFDAIEQLELPVPVPEPGEILIKVEYAGMNAIDLHNRKGSDPLSWLPPLPAALGSECAGTIVALPTDEAVLAHPEYQKRGFRIGSRVVASGVGAFAEYKAAHWLLAHPLPENITTRDAAAATVQGITAYVFLAEAYTVQPGHYVLVHTVAGGCGLFFTQYIKARGGIVIGTTSTPEKAAIAKEYGADHVILYKNEDVVARVLEITGGEGVHAVFDGVGKDTFENNFKLIRRSGTVVLYGSTSGDVESLSPKLLFPKTAKLVHGSAGTCLANPKDGRERVAEFFKTIAEGRVKILVQKEYPFTADGVRDAQIALDKGTSVGKLIIKVASSSA